MNETAAAAAIDRIAPTRRPRERVVMRQRWADLLFLHWPVEPAAIARLLPPGLTLDIWEGRAYVGLVPFTMTGVRPVWSPRVPGLSDFHEVNVRTYVHRDGANPGVWFFSLDAANTPAVRIARALWRLPYHRARMLLRRDGRQSIEYASERLWPGPLPAGCRLRYTIDPVEPRPSQHGTLEFFLAERYFLYAFDGSELWRGQVHHTPYPLQSARLDRLEDSLVLAAGIHVESPAAPPLVHYASGVDVEVFPLKPVR